MAKTLDRIGRSLAKDAMGAPGAERLAPRSPGSGAEAGRVGVEKLTTSVATATLMWNRIGLRA